MSDPGGKVALRVLVVDDCQDTTATMAILMRLWGHQAWVAHDGPSALTAARGCRPDVVLLDVGLPGSMDGFDVARHLRAQGGFAQAVLISLTGFAQDAYRLRSREAGCDYHLVKPVDLPELRELLGGLVKSPA